MSDRIAKGIIVGIGTGFLSMVAIPALVGAIGFGAGGIAAGSTAAWMMSLGGGTTPALVSVCQSIGATGVIAGATAVKVGVAAGALSALGGDDAAQPQNRNDEDEESSDDDGAN
ncbi:hypothetical protein L596_016697 [Steinernema carpocapsae]|uniref:Uncharacterized protein n=1 Tax=Steinernema carpocapsae TaxID=34508 RepID=A0A4U5NJL0_STECR|nr:hypothetical protein L596_016697 [Steinernema carpocapsae]